MLCPRGNLESKESAEKARQLKESTESWPGPAPQPPFAEYHHVDNHILVLSVIDKVKHAAVERICAVRHQRSIK